MPDLMSIPAGVPAEDYQAFIDAQRQQMLANALMSSAFTPPTVSNPAPVNGLYVQPRVGAVQGAAKIAEALLGKRATNQAVQSQVSVQQALNQAYAPGQNGQVNPRNPFGAPADVVRNLAMTAPDKYAAYLQGTPEWQNALAAYGGNVTKAMAAMQQGFTKFVRPGEVGFQPGAPGAAPQATVAAPNAEGVQTTFGPNGPQASNVPGSLDANRAAAAATAAGTQSQQFVKIGTDKNGRDLYAVLTPPGPTTEVRPPGVAPPGTVPQAPGAPRAPGASALAGPGAPGAPPAPTPAPSPARPPLMSATTPGQTAGPAEVAQQKGGGEASASYAADLAKNATGATEVLRSLSELSNLARQANPAGMNAGKMRLGSYMIASGVPADTVGKWLGVDVGALQAAQKQTATLAVNTIHSMTNRGTNFDMQTFMENNPNLNLADPAAFQRVVDYMKGKANQEVAKNSDFVQWRQTAGKNFPPDEWENAHTAHWLDLQQQLIQSGQTNSRPPLSSFVSPGS